MFKNIKIFKILIISVLVFGIVIISIDNFPQKPNWKVNDCVDISPYIKETEKFRNKLEQLYIALLKRPFENYTELHNLDIRGTKFKIYSLLQDPTVEAIAKDGLGAGATDQNYEYPILDRINFNKKDKVIDIGAHYGLISIYIAKKNPQVDIYSFEPSKTTYTCLQENIKVNNIKNIKSFNAGVGLKNEEKEFYFSPINTWGSSDTPGADFQNFSFSEKVKMKNLSDVLKSEKIDKIKLLKVDCEGCEYDVFESMSDETLQKIEYLVVEAHAYVSDHEQRWNKINDRIRKNIKPENLNIVVQFQ